MNGALTRWRRVERARPRFGAWLIITIASTTAVQPAPPPIAPQLELKSPLDFQVFQRSTRSRGGIVVTGRLSPALSNNDAFVREVRLTGPGVDGRWQPLSKEITNIGVADGAFREEVSAPAGGWYHFELRLRRGTSILTNATVEHVGVGEVLVVAGQSNSANHGEQKQRAASDLVSVFNFAEKRWQRAEDPQPGATGSGGSFLPPFADQIAARFKVPVGLLAAGVGATSVREWLPPGIFFPQPPTLTGNVIRLPSGQWESTGKLFDNFTMRVGALGSNGCRAVLWHQGESDANQTDPSRTLPGDLYQKYLETLIQRSRVAVGWEVPWFVAQASYHTPEDPGSADIRAAQLAVRRLPNVFEGPDTDALTGDLRDNAGRGVHFSGRGLKAHAEKWAEKLVPWLQEVLTDRPAHRIESPAPRSASALDVRRSSVVINEIHFHPPDKRPLEFVELHNATEESIPLGGWTLERFAFPTNASLAPHGFVVVAEDPDAFQRELGFRPLGPFPGHLSNRGEKLTLRDDRRRIVDEVRYRIGFPWPTATGGAGSSLERVHPQLPSSEPGSWRSAGYPVVTAIQGGVVFIPAGDGQWRYRKGTNEASEPIEAWRRLGFHEDDSWQTARTSIGYEDGDDQTILTDMQGRYTSLFLRHPFVIAGSNPPALLLRVRVDDGCVAWVNGQEVGRLHVKPGALRFNSVGENHEATEEFEELLFSKESSWLPGTNLLAVHVFNASRNSSDLTFDAELRTPDGAPHGKRPTPGQTNSVFTKIIPPSITSVTHEPMVPKSGEPVLVTARLAPASSIAEVRLFLQRVEPGAYVRKTDAAYRTNWVTLLMHDDGRDADLHAGDGLYTARVPGDWQRHRWLIRYRIVAIDRAGIEVKAPMADDAVPNLAWFVYDGLPPWTGARRPGHTAPTTFSSEFLATLPAYQVIARAEDVAHSQWDSSANRRPFFGTFVDEGRVYDHIQFHNRGTGSAYISGKNKWGFKFVRGHELITRDVHGHPYKESWDSLNLNPGLSTPYMPVHAGIAGLDEAVSFRAFQLAGVFSPNSHWVQLRVIDAATEASSTNQYIGDLCGLYLAIQDPDGSLLRETGRPDGNVYSMQSGRKHLARGAPLDSSDWNQFLGGIRNDHDEAWWRANLDLPAYYSFHAISRVIGNVDLRPDGNHGYYRRPDGRWSPFPWDHDMMFVPRVHQPGHIDAIRCLSAPALAIEFRNRAREILDLFCSDSSAEGGQVGALVAELARVVQPPGFTNDWGELDAALWDWHPRQNQKGIFYANPGKGHNSGGPWERKLATADFAGFAKYIVEFCTDSRPVKNYAPNDGDVRGYGFGYLQHDAKDSKIPATPDVHYMGAASHPVGALAFSATPYSSPVTNRFAAMQWRVGYIRAPRGDAAAHYEIETYWDSGELTTNVGSFQIPGTVCQRGEKYRVRARYKDESGRWSHWSPPVQFLGGE